MFSTEPRSVRLVCAIMLVCLAGFAILALAVGMGWTRDADHALLLTLRNPENPNDPLGPAWFEEAAAELTALGGYTILTLVTLAVASVLYLSGKVRATVFLLVAIGGGSMVSTALKLAFNRPRPELVDHVDRVFTSSFPSGHAMISVVAWLTLASIAIRFVPVHGVRVFLISAAIALAVLIGISRVYLGVHWPSDVVAGWFMGGAWAGGCWLTAHVLSRHPRQTGRFGHSET